MNSETKSAYITFSAVLDLFRKYPEYDLKFIRNGWNGENMYIMLQLPDDNSKMTLPYIYLKTANGDFVPWCPSQTDILATDWIQLPAE